MALTRRLVRQLANDLFCSQKPIARVSHHTRSLTTTTRPTARLGRHAGSSQQVKRSFRPSYQIRSASNATETAPNSKAYIESGAIAGAQNLVDVKKVLVIGSGGLAIGQAGEFDYSGMFARV